VALLQPLSHSANESIAAQARTMLDTIEQMKKWRTAQTNGGADIRVAKIPTAPAEPETTEVRDDFELKAFSGTLTKVECPSPAKVIITVNTGRESLVVGGETKAISFGKKPLYCDLRGVRVHGYYNAKKATLVALTVE
jgi:hypothetical protein